MKRSRKNILVIAPHPDDETLGCGGTLLRHRSCGDAIHWLIVTRMSTKCGFTTRQISARKKDIRRVAGLFPFDTIHELGFSTTTGVSIKPGILVGDVGMGWTHGRRYRQVGVL